MARGLKRNRNRGQTRKRNQNGLEQCHLGWIGHGTVNRHEQGVKVWEMARSGYERASGPRPEGSE